MKKRQFEPNSYYQGLVQNLYCGANGCFLCFMQFFYQKLLKYSQNFDCFAKMSEKELENCQIAAQLLQRLSGEPKFYSSSKKFLTGNSLNYCQDIKQIFLYDIELLEVGVQDVKGLIGKIENPAIKDDLKIILENKKYCLKILKENYFKNNLISQN